MRVPGTIGLLTVAERVELAAAANSFVLSLLYTLETMTVINFKFLVLVT